MPDPLEAMRLAYKMTDEVLKARDEPSGCTAVSAIIQTKNNKTTLYAANVGDSRIVLNHGGIAKRLTYDHKASDTSEQFRIEAFGGTMKKNKVGGVLAVTRAFGDIELGYCVRADDPHLTQVELSPKDTHVILACDGLWDVVTDQEAVNAIDKSANSQQICQKLLNLALEKNTTDNLTIMVICL